MMRRREFITLVGGAAAVWPAVARGQQAMPVVGYLSSASPDEDRHKAFRRGLSEHGYVEGQNVSLEFRWAESHYARLASLLSELERRRVAIILAGGNQAALAVRKANTPTPSVFVIGDDPVGIGLVPGLSRPLANLTGVTFHSGALAGKRLEFLHELVSPTSAIAMLINPATPRHELQRTEMEVAARSLGRRIEFVHAGTIAELETALQELLAKRIGGFFYNTDPFFNAERRRLINFAAQHRLPVVYSGREYALLGGLLSYGAPQLDAYRQAGDYVGRIMRGENPANLPVLQPVRFELILNLRTARELGIALTPRQLALADEVIE